MNAGTGGAHRMWNVPSTPSRHSARRSARAGTWCRPTGGSSGNEPGAVSSPTSWLADGSPLSFAALWERWSRDGESLETFTIITTAASPALADMHNRQPAIIDPGRFDDWLDPTSPVPWLLELVRAPCASPYERQRRQYQGKQRPERRSGYPGSEVGDGAFLNEGAEMWLKTLPPRNCLIREKEIGDNRASALAARSVFHNSL